jgi:hypothetical protein
LYGFASRSGSQGALLARVSWDETGMFFHERGLRCNFGFPIES